MASRPIGCEKVGIGGEVVDIDAMKVDVSCDQAGTYCVMVRFGDKEVYTGGK